MPGSHTDSFTSAYSVDDDGAMHFCCAADVARWPWLALPACDPIVVQTVNFHASYESSIFRGDYQQGQWTALTKIQWRCGDPDAGHATRGVVHRDERDGSARYQLDFFDAGDRPVYAMRGEGVVFRNRDFAAWREQQRRGLQSPTGLSGFKFAPAAAVGVETAVESLVGALSGPGERSARALVTRENGFPPLHPYHDGSGDHVNAAHLADVARQFFRLLTRSPDLRIAGGDMTFLHYVELDVPIELEAEKEQPDAEQCDIAVSQGGRVCARISLARCRA